MSTGRQPRRLRVFAVDPSTGRDFTNVDVRSVTISLPADMDPDVGIGPSGRCVEVLDYDPASQAFYAPADLSELQPGGLPPAPDDPQFHQQMVYAVVMNTVTAFEEALGRIIFWAPERYHDGAQWQEEMTEKLRIYPHALREANAFYDPTKKALLFGYFVAPEDSRGAPPGTTVFTCLSHDIIVHETVHAILDGLHPHYAENSGPDTRALHEAFSDIIALFALFSFPEVLEAQIAKTRGDLRQQSLLGQLAQEFGQTVGRGHALRDFLGEDNGDGWKAKPADPLALQKAKGPHARGSVLVAAVFRAFLTIYTNRTKDLFRIASNGSGKLRDGEIDPDLKRRLSYEAAQCARRITRICIRAMDYMPPATVSFGDYLRAIITADHDLYPEDTQSYRDALIEAFTAWGVLPKGMPVISEATLLWPSLAEAEADKAPHPDGQIDEAMLSGHLGMFIRNPGHVLDRQRYPGDQIGADQISADQLRRIDALADQAKLDIKRARERNAAQLYQFEKDRLGRRAPKEVPKGFGELNAHALEIGDSMDRETEYFIARYYRRVLWFLLSNKCSKRFADLIGITFDEAAPATVFRSLHTKRPSLHVASVRVAKRTGPRGQIEREYVIELVQSRRGYFDPKRQAWEDDQNPCFDAKPPACDFTYRAGTTFLIDSQHFRIRRLIRTAHSITDDTGLALQRAHLLGVRQTPLNAFHSGLSSGGDTAFADLHRHGDDDDWGSFA